MKRGFYSHSLINDVKGANARGLVHKDDLKLALCVHIFGISYFLNICDVTGRYFNS